MLVDSHCHLDHAQLAGERAEVLARAREGGIAAMLTIATRVARFDDYRAIAESEADVVFSIGTHPHQAHEELDVPASRLVELARHPRCVGIGEAGLDYFYRHSTPEAQAQGLRTHIAAARDSGLPLVIHSRDADDDMARILEEEHAKGPFAAVLHCFTGGADLARRAVALGHYVSFSGVLTFKKSEALREIAAVLPLERLLVETDAPFLAPEPFRGKRNEPAHVRHTAECLARVRGLSPAAIARQTTANFLRLFTKAEQALPALRAYAEATA
jgi:TatD DNase family protein